MNNRPARPPRGAIMPVGKINFKTVKKLFSYISRFKLRLLIVFLCILVSSFISIASSWFLGKYLVGEIIQKGALEKLPLAILLMALIYLLGISFTYLYNRIMVTVSQGVLKSIRDDMFTHMQKLPIRYFDTHTHGDIMSHYTNDTDTLRQMISQSIPQFFSSVITIVSIFFAMLSTSPAMTLFVILFILFMMIFVKKIGGKSAQYFIRQQKSLGDMNGFIEEMINGQKVVKVFCHEEKAKADFDKKNGVLCSDATSANRFANILMPIMGNFSHFQYALVAIIGGALAISGVYMNWGDVGRFLVGGVYMVLDLGSMVTFLQYSTQFTMPVTMVSQQFNSIVMALAGAERIFALMEEPAEADDGYVTLVNAREENGVITETDEHTGMWAWKHPHGDGTTTYVKLRGDVKFFDVDFAYTEGKTVLHNISLYASPGQKIAFVGATGAGKTTITNLINRFYDIADGKIRYDDININKIKKSDLRRSLGMVLQDTNLFTGTVMENIRYGNLNATDEEVYAAAKLVSADDFISRLPDGYNTMLTGDGANLSQGQRQLLSIARAAVADPPVMILDEATSSIDTRTEAIVQKGMDALMRGRTVFVIAHRLSTVRNSDVIMVLEKGRIIEKGNHEKLIAEHGKYYQLYTGAFELE